MENETLVLQALRLKGRPATADVAAATGLSEADSGEALSALVTGELAKEANDRYMLLPAGRERLNQLLDEERPGLDKDALKGMYDEFTALNSDFKEIVTAWQIRDGEPNPHDDEAYDKGIVDQLNELDKSFAPLGERIAGAIPRLAPYPARFANALEKVNGGDHTFIARPLADSYHTVWFELHEELIGALGLSREEDAASGRAE